MKFNNSIMKYLWIAPHDCFTEFRAMFWLFAGLNGRQVADTPSFIAAHHSNRKILAESLTPYWPPNSNFSTQGVCPGNSPQKMKDDSPTLRSLWSWYLRSSVPEEVCRIPCSWLYIFHHWQQFIKKPTLFRQPCQQFIVVMAQVYCVWPICVQCYGYEAGSHRTGNHCVGLSFLKLPMQNIVAWSTSNVVEYYAWSHCFQLMSLMHCMVKCIHSAISVIAFGVIEDLTHSSWSFRSVNMKAHMSKLFRLMEKHNGSNAKKQFLDTVIEVCQIATQIFAFIDRTISLSQATVHL